MGGSAERLLENVTTDVLRRLHWSEACRCSKWYVAALQLLALTPRISPLPIWVLLATKTLSKWVGPSQPQRTRWVAGCRTTEFAMDQGGPEAGRNISAGSHFILRARTLCQLLRLCNGSPLRPQCTCVLQTSSL